ncbi:PVR cell adhesion molecule related 2 like, partial [Trichomycterus rosablanca]|uniref:PVR cell adhesion molecule related 2 like n=1 Tax=Trichomycterus rosablanca TaxID=2290929 RepID=UPI002F35B777
RYDQSAVLTLVCHRFSCLLALCQRVRVLPEVEAYPNKSVNLRCEFINAGTSKLTQVSWIFEASEGQRENIAVFHPMYGESFPQSSFKGRVQFTQGSLENPSIRIDNVRMSDAGRYTCEYATYPSGNEQGTTMLIMLAKAKNSAFSVMVPASSSKLVVARCESAQGKPLASISWVTSANGEYNSTQELQLDGTVTVKSEYIMAPASTDNGRDLTCVITQGKQDPPQNFAVKLAVHYPPTVRIEGYDDNWYMGRKDVVLKCHADANPKAFDVTWTTVSGKLPATVRVAENTLLVQTVDESMNTTFICEAKNSLGSGKSQLTPTIIELSDDPSRTGALVAAILGSLLALLLVSALVAVLVTHSRHQQHGYLGDGKQDIYINKAQFFGTKNISKNGTGTNNNGSVYSYHESKPGALNDKANEYQPASHNMLLTIKLDEVDQQRFEAFTESMQEAEEDERFDGYKQQPTTFHIQQIENECGEYPDDNMESQRDGSVISRTAIYV